jgi:SAM-dependent methyltransferase
MINQSLYLNLGCGSRFHPAWTNVDLVSNHPDVQAWDVRDGLPFSDDTFQVVYHSHLLEHLPKSRALPFLKECFRVLKPSGILRIAVPDLETIARLYIHALEKALGGDAEWQDRYEWMVIELCDQMVRERPGGEMRDYYRQDPIPAQGFVMERMGGDARRMAQSGRRKPWQGIHSLRKPLRLVQLGLFRFLLGSHNYRALQIGRFRLHGEIHQWMYDRYSLGKLLEESCFQNINVENADTSAIENWVDFRLDTEPDGSVYKPDSLYLEAVKPGS